MNNTTDARDFSPSGLALTKPQLMELAWSYRNEVFGTWLRRGVNIEDLEDCFAEAVLKITEVRDASQVRASLHRAVGWQVGDMWRKKKVSESLQSRQGKTKNKTLMRWIKPESSGERGSDTVLFLESVIKQVPDIYQEALVLRVLGDDVEDIAESLKINKLAFKSRYHRAQKMARQIAGEGKYSA